VVGMLEDLLRKLRGPVNPATGVPAGFASSEEYQLANKYFRDTAQRGNVESATAGGYSPTISAMGQARGTTAYPAARQAALDALPGGTSSPAGTGAALPGATPGAGTAPPAGTGAITPWDPAKSPLYQAILAGYQAQVPQAVGAVRADWFGRGPGMGESTWSKSAQAEMGQRVLGQAVGQMPGVAQFETGLQESALNRALRQRETDAAQGRQSWERGMAERQFGEEQRQFDSRAAQDQKEWARRLAADAAGTGKVGDDLDLNTEFSGFIQGLEKYLRYGNTAEGGISPGRIKAMLAGAIASQTYTQDEADLIWKGIAAYMQSRNIPLDGGAR
jgi:hypothetical protein